MYRGALHEMPPQRRNALSQVRLVGGVFLTVAAVITYVLGLVYFFSPSQRLELDPWFLHWAGIYDIVVSILGIVGAACAICGVRTYMVAGAAFALVLAGLFDFGMNGTFFGGLCILFFSGLGLALVVNPSLMMKQSTEAVYFEDIATGHRDISQGLGVEATYVPQVSRKLERGFDRRVVAGNLLGLASVLLVIQATGLFTLSLWYHPSEGYLDVEWGSLAMGLYQMASAIVGLIGAYMLLKRRKSPIPIVAALMVFTTVIVILLFPAYWISFFLPIIAMMLGFVVMVLLILDSMMVPPTHVLRDLEQRPIMGVPPRVASVREDEKGGNPDEEETDR